MGMYSTKQVLDCYNLWQNIIHNFQINICLCKQKLTTLSINVLIHFPQTYKNDSFRHMPINIREKLKTLERKQTSTIDVTWPLTLRLMWTPPCSPGFLSSSWVADIFLLSDSPEKLKATIKSWERFAAIAELRDSQRINKRVKPLYFLVASDSCWLYRTVDDHWSHIIWRLRDRRIQTETLSFGI